jgi:hypothetical protein
MLFSVHVLKPPLVSLPTPTRGTRNPSDTIQSRLSTPRVPKRCVLASRTGPRPAHPGDSPRSHAAREPRQRSAGSSPWGAVPGVERADPAPHLEAGARLGSAGERQIFSSSEIFFNFFLQKFEVFNHTSLSLVWLEFPQDILYYFWLL